MIKTCVFVGPTRVNRRDYPQIDFFPPAALGSVFRAFEAGYRRIGIIDGFFGNTPSVWHKEVLFAIAAGAEVSGAASTGALRAAELAPMGMRGIGRIFRLYRMGAIADDDEVCVLHGVAEMDFAPLSEPMISIRFTLRRLRRGGLLTVSEEQGIAGDLKALHFSERTIDQVRQSMERQIPSGRREKLLVAYRAQRLDAKGVDAGLLLDWLGESRPAWRPPAWEFPRTVHWVHQFEDRAEDVPSLGHAVS